MDKLKLSKKLSKDIINFLKENPGLKQDFIDVTNLVGVVYE